MSHKAGTSLSATTHTQSPRARPARARTPDRAPGPAQEEDGKKVDELRGELDVLAMTMAAFADEK
jgi:hypothetical protein